MLPFLLRRTRAFGLNLIKIWPVFLPRVSTPKADRLAAMTRALAFIRLCERLTDRALIFGLVCFAIGLCVGRFTAHMAVFWGLLGG
jgi:hypothetical protein